MQDIQHIHPADMRIEDISMPIVTWRWLSRVSADKVKSRCRQGIYRTGVIPPLQSLIPTFLSFILFKIVSWILYMILSIRYTLRIYLTQINSLRVTVGVWASCLWVENIGPTEITLARTSSRYLRIGWNFWQPPLFWSYIAGKSITVSCEIVLPCLAPWIRM